MLITARIASRYQKTSISGFEKFLHTGSERYETVRYDTVVCGKLAGGHKPPSIKEHFRSQ